MHTDFVENMLTVHKKYRDLIQEVFQGDQVNVCTLQCSDCIPAVQAFVGVAQGRDLREQHQGERPDPAVTLGQARGIRHLPGAPRP